MDAVIPARGGSKGIPRKNLATIACRSLIARAIRCCQESLWIDRVWVSTDCEEIAAEAKEHGAWIIHRPASLATDEADTSDVIRHACEYVTGDAMALVQCTAPTMSVGEISGTIEALRPNVDTAVAVAKSDVVLLERRDGRFKGVGWDWNSLETRRQDRQQRFAVLGSVWAFWISRFLSRGSVYSDNMAAYVANRHHIEIDEPADLALARKLLGGR